MASLVSYALVAFIWHGAHAAPRPHLANGTSQPSSRAVPSAPARLGIATQSGPTGVTVMTVTAGSAAARTGIRTGDVLTAVDDVPVDSPAHLTSIVRSHRAGDTIRVVLVRNGRRITVVATLDSA